MSLGAIKQFKEATGLDLWCTLLTMIEISLETSDQKLSVASRMRAFYEACPFDVGAQAFHALIKAENKSIPLSEIEDAMFRVGWRATEREGDISEPWPLVLVTTAYKIDKFFEQLEDKHKKKADTSEQKEKK